jgi:hypothetical protein
MGAFIKIGWRSKISKVKRIILHIPCTWSWHNLSRKAMMFSHNNNWCSCRYTSMTSRCKGCYNFNSSLIMGVMPHWRKHFTLCKRLIKKNSWWKLVSLLSPWPPKNILKRRDQWPPIVGRQKKNQNAGQFGPSPSFQRNKVKGCVGLVESSYEEVPKWKQYIYIQIQNFKYQKMWTLWC